MEERVEKYMRSRTAEGRGILEPTGKQKIHPSKVTHMKTWKFGLGTSDPTVIDFMQAKYNEQPPSALLSTSQLAYQPSGEGNADLIRPTPTPDSSAPINGRQSPRYGTHVVVLNLNLIRLSS